jgi:hypothetical protein
VFDEMGTCQHDVDSVLHLIFSKSNGSGIYESLCNPPGGDWSGISIIDFHSQEEYRWTSLPRVSGDETKRPDHLIQFKLNNTLLSIESKDHPRTLEKSIGPRLIKYVTKLFKIQPNSYRKNASDNWGLYKGKNIGNDFKILSGVAFRYISDDSVKETFRFGDADVAFGVEFNKNKETTIHIVVSDRANYLLPLIKERIKKFSSCINLIVH